ncbi:MAG: serine/threonine-protein kinase, partial [Kofleriaceae bacterium]
MLDPDSDPDLSAPPDAPDPLDQLLGAAVRAPAELPRFGPGDELLGRFKIERLVGIGGMGSVYLATDPTLERQVALKLHHGADTARLLREAVAMARLAHPNVIAVYEVGEIAGQAFVVMEYVAGTTLRAWHGAAPRSTREVLAMLLGAGAGLAAAHDAGLVHRDFKPENVLVAGGRPRVGDFGLARGSQSHDDHDADPATANTAPDDGTSGKLVASLTRTGAVLGTPAYMAPEQITGAIVDARADQFAFCIVAWELLYGERPFAGADLGALARAIEAGPRKPPSGPRVRAAIRRVLERGLAADPTTRYPD